MRDLESPLLHRIKIKSLRRRGAIAMKKFICYIIGLLAFILVCTLPADTRDQADTGEPVVITGLAAITGLEIIMGTAGTMGMEIRITLVLRSAQAGVDGGPGGGVLPTPIIHTTRTIQRRLSLSNDSPRCMFSRISRNLVTGTTVRIPKATTPTLNPARAAG
jgi:hypothetical protein